jgi:ribonucleoside-diphosphate reductase subunit M1
MIQSSDVVVLLSGCSVKVMYTHINERSGLMSPLIADDVYEIIMKVHALEVNRVCVFDGNVSYSYIPVFRHV